MMNVIIDGVQYVPVGSELLEPSDLPPVEDKKFNAPVFFDAIRESLFYGSLNQNQVDGINALGRYLLAIPGEPKIPLQAYMLATFQHETASTMQPIEEYGGAAARYTPWYGRGYVQLTWEENYSKQQKKLEKHPLRPQAVPYRVHEDWNLALNPDTSALISIYGMLDGDFTGVKLGDYINEKNIDYINARRVVNGTDQAEYIASLAEKWEAAIRAGWSGWAI